MQTVDWNTLTDRERRALLERPAAVENERLSGQVSGIVAAVRAQGDAAVAGFTKDFDGVELSGMQVSDAEFAEARAALEDRALAALNTAIRNVHTYHSAQRREALRVETAPGVTCEQLHIPIRAVGFYVPAGTAPLPSAVVMMGVPARIAGCPERVLCTPPRRDGSADPGVVTAAALCGIDKIYKVGGAQAIAAMAYGTETVPKVDKLFGPGNQWVTAAKVIVSTDPAGAAIDLPAGPSEVLVIADSSANPEFVAADLLAQAEHGPDSQVILVTTDTAIAEAVARAVERQLTQRSRAQIASRALENSRIVVADDLSTAMGISNAYAPEHLILNVERPRYWLARVESAGSVFLGPWTPETVGDYCSGTNHVLPTYGFARSHSGLGLSDFLKTVSVQELTREGIANIGPTARVLADLEGLDAHGHAVTVRLDALTKGNAA